MNIKLGSIATIFLILVFGWLEIGYAQQSLKEKPCRQSVKEILSEINAIHHLSHAPDKVLVAGEVYAPQLLANEKSLSLPRAIAKVGGFSKNAGRSVYLLRQGNNDEAPAVSEIDLREFKEEYIKDLLLKNGDVVFVPRRCSNRKTVPFKYVPIRFLEVHRYHYQLSIYPLISQFDKIA